MSRAAEAALVLAAAGLAAFGVSLVNFAGGGGIDAQTALTFLVFVLAFGGLLTAHAGLGTFRRSVPHPPCRHHLGSWIRCRLSLGS